MLYSGIDLDASAVKLMMMDERGEIKNIFAAMKGETR